MNITCNRCQKRYRNEGEWNTVFHAGRIAGYVCPDCQTAEEHVEAVVNETLTDYDASEEIIGVTEALLADVLNPPASPDDYDLTGWADHINRGLVAALRAGHDVKDPDVFAEHVNRLANTSAPTFYRKEK